MIVYRCIRFEGTPEQINRQLIRSLSPGHFKVGQCDIRIIDTVEDPLGNTSLAPWDDLPEVTPGTMIGGGIRALDNGPPQFKELGDEAIEFFKKHSEDLAHPHLLEWDKVRSSLCNLVGAYITLSEHLNLPKDQDARRQ